MKRPRLTSLLLPLLLLPSLLLLATPRPWAAAADETFGRSENNGEAALIGIFYDLKQTQQRKPTGVLPRDYIKILGDFIGKGWDESVFAPYFRAVRTLYTTQIFVPMMSAALGPKAFGLQDVVKPSEWVAHYKGQVSPPADGTYRFLGYADDIIAVAVNDKTVLVGSRFPVPSWTIPSTNMHAANGLLTAGPWLELKKDQIIDLDVIIGERPGGDFCAFLLYEQRGARYPVNQQNEPLLPLFQLARHDTPASPSNLAPAFSLPAIPWRAYQ